MLSEVKLVMKSGSLGSEGILASIDSTPEITRPRGYGIGSGATDTPEQSSEDFQISKIEELETTIEVIDKMPNANSKICSHENQKIM